jgi:hypothetical protein
VEGFVPDETTAIAIAELVLTPVYGKQTVTSERPFRALVGGKVWTIKGSVLCDGPPGSICPGGAAEVQISKSTGQVFYEDARNSVES